MKNPKLTFLLIILLTIVSLLIIISRIPITIHNKFVNIDTSIGGYVFTGKDGKIILNLSEFKEGLDIKGGVRVVLKANMDKILEAERDNALNAAKTVIAKRVDLLGVSEPVIQTSKVGNEFRIIVELPGVTDVTEALASIGQTAQLNFKQLKKDAATAYNSLNAQEYFLNANLWEDTAVTGADLKGADVVFSADKNFSDSPQIKLRFSNEGRTKFAELAKANVNKPIGIFLDQGQFPLSMPTVSPDLAQGLVSDPVITGSFTVEEATRLSISLTAGALPVPVSVLEQKVVGATLGSDSIRKSLIAGVIGIIIVAVFMIVSYGRFGLLANVALLIYGIITLALFKLIPIVITLPGLAGFILSIGMAVDANILTFERIKEELNWGKPLNLAIKLGFERSWSSIKDSNISSLLTSAVLFYFGTGIVKGFALTLAVGIVVSMFTAVFVTRSLINIFIQKSA